MVVPNPSCLGGKQEQHKLPAEPLAMPLRPVASAASPVLVGLCQAVLMSSPRRWGRDLGNPSPITPKTWAPAPTSLSCSQKGICSGSHRACVSASSASPFPSGGGTDLRVILAGIEVLGSGTALMPSTAHQSYKYLTAPLGTKSKIPSKTTSKGTECGSLSDMLPGHWHLGSGSLRSPKISVAFFLPLDL